MNRDYLLKTIEREKLYLLPNSTSFEMQVAYMLNAFLDNLKDMNEEEIISTLRIFKVPMMNIALALNQPL
jgi:hypothetical protein